MRYALLLSVFLLASFLPSRAAAQSDEEDSVPVTFTAYINHTEGGGYSNCSYALVGSHADPVGNGRDSDYRYPFNWDPGSTYFDGYVGRTPPEWTGVAEDIPGERITFYAAWAASSGPTWQFEGCDSSWGSGYSVEDQNAYFAPVPNKPPTACFDHEEADAPLTVDFDASCSEDKDGQVTSYDWDFAGDGAGGGGEQASFTYEERGSYEVMLVVIDDDGDESGPFSQTIAVRGPDLRYEVLVEPFTLDEEVTENEEGAITVGDTVLVHVVVENVGDWKLENVILPAGQEDILITADPEDALVFLPAEDELVDVQRENLDMLDIGETDTLVYIYQAQHATGDDDEDEMDDEASLLVREVAAEAINPNSGNRYDYSETEEECPIAGKRAAIQEDNTACVKFVVDPAPFIVNSVEDAALAPGIDPDKDGCSTGRSITRGSEMEPECTLRAAVQAAAMMAAEHVKILFDIPGTSSVYTIAPSGTALPALAKSITLMGPSKDGTPVEIDGSELPAGVAFDLGGEETTVASLAFYGFPGTVLALRGSGSSVTGSLFGSDWARSYADAEASGALRNGGTAIHITGDRTRIGGSGSDGNLIIGSDIGIHVDGAWHVNIQGNDIGILEMPHARHGIDLTGAVGARIGTPEAPNRINFNLEYGIRLDAATTEAVIQANEIIRSRKDGILAQQGSSGGAEPVRIGGEEGNEGNRIERSIGAGIRVVGPADATAGEARVVIQGNRLKENEEIGIRLEGGSQVLIGGPAGEPGTGAGNDIQDGVRLEPGYASWVQGNRIAVIDPETGFSEEGAALYVGGVRNTIGGETAAEGNVIYGVPAPDPDEDNPEDEEEPSGFGIWDAGTTTTIQRNLIGTEGALFTGVVLEGTDAEVIENTISGNEHVGLSVRAPATIEGNYIGTTPTGGGALPNGGPGIEVFVAATIGGHREDEACERPCNVISGNGGPGIFVRQEASGTTIQGNMIGLGKNGLTLVGNGESGVVVLADGVTIGGENDVELFDCLGPCNLIAGNGEDGIRNFEVQEFPNLSSEGGAVTHGATTDGASGLVIEGNFIGTGLPGGGNAGHGIALGALGSANRIGDTAGRGNLITGNGGAGVLVLASTESTVLNGTTWRGGTGNRIRGNRIHDNGGIAIDLYPNYILYDLGRMASETGYGWSPLDMGDEDEGPNTMLNWPYLIESAAVAGIDGQRSLLVLWTGNPNTMGGTYTLDVYTSAGCRGATADAGNFLVSREIAFPVGGNIEAMRVDVPFVESMPYYVATFTDSEGNTSELGNCRREGQRPEQALQNVDVGVRTLVNKLLIQLEAEAGGKSASTQPVLVLRSAATPGDDLFEATAAETPAGEVVVPQRTKGDYWEVLLPGAPAAMRYDVCLDATGLSAPDDLLVLGRGAATGGLWWPHDTRLETVDGVPYACADDLTALHLTLGTGTEAVLAVPVLLTPEDGATGIDLTSTFSWQAVDGAAGYDLQISLDAAFGVLLSDETGLAGTSYAPATLARSQRHHWRVRGVTASGEAGPWSRSFQFTTGETSVDAEEADEVPERFVLEGNYPNPFNPQTTIGFTLPQTTDVRLVVYDVLGREVAVLVDGVKPAGRHEAVFEASGLPTGIYLYRIEAGGVSATRRMLLLK